ncbi:MAG TPA: CBS domain-containing protein [Hyphomicrobiaceae bacterium]|jgi:CBS domain-containing protein|nr:CBS domain-containing protein [Hyphomicrobiaceae bacterium]
MTNRELTYIVKDQKPLVLADSETVRQACRCMWQCRSGSVLVVDRREHLSGIFTGRDAVRLLAKAKDAGAGGARLAKAMTRHPVAIGPKSRAIDALRAMSDGGFRHVPVTEDGKIKGVVSRSDLKGMELEEYRWQRMGSASLRTFRGVAQVIEGQKLLVAGENDTVQHACRSMWRRKSGSILVVDREQRLSGIFTGRDAVRVLANVENAAAAQLADVMTRNPATITPEGSAIDALRAMDDGGFRHLPVIEKNKILGVVSRSDFTGIEIDRLEEEEHLKEVIW